MTSPPNPNRFLTAARVWWAIFIAWAVAITVLAAIPGNRFGPSPFSFADKLVHFSLFFTGAFFLGGALRSSTTWGWLRIGCVVFVAVAALGVANEIHQLYTPGRSGADPGDMVANAAGALAGAILLAIFYGLGTRKRSAPQDPGPAAADRAA